MDTSDEEAFLRELVKASRQKLHHVKWVDRDGTERVTSLTQAEVVRLNAMAQRAGTSKAEILRRAAFIPNRKPAAGPPPSAT
jgi:capsid protein